MSRFVTQTGTVVTCEDPSCACQDGPTYGTTAGSVLAADEERWFGHVCDAVEEYLAVVAQQQDAPKSLRDSFDEKVHEAKRAVIDQFYAMGWDKP